MSSLSPCSLVWLQYMIATRLLNLLSVGGGLVPAATHTGGETHRFSVGVYFQAVSAMYAFSFLAYIYLLR